MIVKNPWFLTLILLGGCSVGPNYKQPDDQISNEWMAPENTEVDLTNKDPVVMWWKMFDDPLLDKYIEEAIARNYTLQIAEATIFQARATKKGAVSYFYPHIGSDVFAGRVDPGKNGIFPQPPTLPASIASEVKEPSRIQNLFAFLFDASWEIDIFGKTRRSVEAASAQIESAIATKNDVLISIMAETARNYMEVRSAQKNKELTEKNIELYEAQSKLIEERKKFGLDNNLNLDQIQANLDSIKSTLPNIEAQIYSSIYALAVLLGHEPEALLAEMIEPKPLPKAPRNISLGLRSDLLRRRPDVRRAERDLAMANAQIGVAVANLFPSFSLIGLLGVTSTHLHNLFTNHSKIWAYGGNLATPIFEGGRLRANVEFTKAATVAAAAEYEQTVLSALQDAETSLSNFMQSVATENLLHENVKKNESLVALNQERFTKGLSSRIDLLKSEEQLVSAQQNLVLSQTSTLIDFIAFYKALGGGWEMENEVESLPDVPPVTE